MFPKIQGLDAELKKIQILGVQKAWPSGQACDCMCRNQRRKDGLGPECRELCMPGASLRVQVWLLKQGDPHNSGLNNMEVDISDTAPQW